MIQFFAIPGASGKVRLKVEKPVGSDGAMLRYKTSAWTSGDTKDTGTLIASVTDDSSYDGANEWYEVSGLTNGTAYYFKAFPYSGTSYNETIGANESHSKAGGLELEYTMDSISGSTLNDTSGNSRNGTIYDASATTGIVGNGMTAAGTSHRIASAYMAPSSSRTITAIVKMPSTTTTALQTGLVYYGSAGFCYFGINVSGYEMQCNANDGGIFTKSYSANATCILAFGTTSDTAAWAKFDGDGRVTGSGTKNTNTSQNDLLNNAAITARYMRGILDQYRVWSRSLEDYELDNIYNGGMGC